MLVEAMDGLEIGTFSGLDGALDRVWETGAQGISIRMGAYVRTHFLNLADRADLLRRGWVPDDWWRCGIPPFAAIEVDGLLTGWSHPLSGMLIPIDGLAGDPCRIEFHAESVPPPLSPEAQWTCGCSVDRPARAEVAR